MSVFAIQFQPFPVSERNLDLLFQLENIAEVPPHVALVEGEDAEAALLSFVMDDNERCRKTGLIAVVKHWEQVK